MAFIAQQNSNVFKTKFTSAGGVIVVLLGLALLALGERILYDTGRLLVPPPLDYFDNASVIAMHAVVIILFIIIALVLNIAIGERKEKYAVALVPYYVVSIILAVQLLMQVSVYFYNHHTTVEFYVVMLALALVCTYSIYFLQKRFEIHTY